MKVDPKRNHRYPYKREAEGDFIHKEEKMLGRQTQKLEWCSHKPRNANSHQKLEEAKNRVSSRDAGGGAALPTPRFQCNLTDFRHLASRTLTEYMSVVSSHQVCYSSHRKLKQMYSFSPTEMFRKNYTMNGDHERHLIWVCSPWLYCQWFDTGRSHRGKQNLFKFSVLTWWRVKWHIIFLKSDH